jgi:hypothetical protein
MPTEMAIPNNQQELVPGKGKSLAQIDEVQREKEAAIEIQRAYRGYCPLKFGMLIIGWIKLGRRRLHQGIDGGMH